MIDNDVPYRSYYAIITADVRYSKKLTSSAKLLYAEITALCNDKGYCWASNQYFADLYVCSERSITRNLALLKKYRFINILFENEKRQIYIARTTLADVHSAIYSINKNEI